MLIGLGNELTARREPNGALLSSPRTGQSRSKRTKPSYMSVPQQVPGKVT
jgi:hypothetical protein